MKTLIYVGTLTGLLAVSSTRAQNPPPTPPGIGIPQRLNPGKSSEEPLTRFNLDFAGGTPRQLVAAIQKAMDKPLNAIVPDEFASTKLPELKMNNVNVRELFTAIEMTSQKSEAYVAGTYGPGRSQSYQLAQTSYGFRTSGNPTDDSIWYFYVQKPAFPPLTQPGKTCRFYSLAALLERGQTVDDITTAVQTGWKMLGDKETPVINFHKDTKLLIAVGEESKLGMIDDVLRALESSVPRNRPTPPPPAEAKPIQAKPKTEN